MFRWIGKYLVARRLARLQRLDQLAQEVDELLAFGKLADGTRQQLQASREQLEQEARALMFG